MDKPVLVILAAGMGGRFGGHKQMEPVDRHGNKLLDFSIYDAIRVGFKKIIFVVSGDIETEFRNCIRSEIEKYVEIEYVIQKMNDLPPGCVIPEGRKKPWGTAHAILSCRNSIKEPFGVIGSDGYYGQGAFQLLYDYVMSVDQKQENHFAMVGYELGNTLTNSGSVSRGCCVIDQNNHLVNITERTHIERRSVGSVYSEDNGKTFLPIPVDTIVSMKMWGLTETFLKELAESAVTFFSEEIKKNPMELEFYLPHEVDRMIQRGNATVEVLPSCDNWFGLTYEGDKSQVVEAIQDLKNRGVYPEKLWD